MRLGLSRRASARAAAILILSCLMVSWANAGPATTTTTIPDGACCHPDGSCNDFVESSCTGDSVYQGDGTICDVGVCPQPPDGACCHPDGTCNDFEPSSCTGDSVYQGDGTVCDIGLCPQPSFCGDANLDGTITAPDALIALRTAVHLAFCNNEICDYNGDGDVTASDALAILKTAVGNPVQPKCPGMDDS